MITVYKKKYIPKDMELITINDVYFNKYTVELLDERAKDIIAHIDESDAILPYNIISKFDGAMLNIDKLSSGCKTVLNVLYNENKVFDIRECGENALDELYALEHGNVFCEYPLISFEMQEVYVADKKEKRVICDYEELKRWWSDENKADSGKPD